MYSNIECTQASLVRQEYPIHRGKQHLLLAPERFSYLQVRSSFNFKCRFESLCSLDTTPFHRKYSLFQESLRVSFLRYFWGIQEPVLSNMFPCIHRQRWATLRCAKNQKIQYDPPRKDIIADSSSISFSWYGGGSEVFANRFPTNCASNDARKIRDGRPTLR